MFESVLFNLLPQGSLELMMKSMLMGRWKRTWVKAEKAQGQMMKSCRGRCT